MKQCLAICLLLLIAAALAGKITTSYDNINIDRILSNERLVKNYVNCLLDRGRCTPDGEELKKQLPNALRNECADCSEQQRSGAEKVFRHLMQHYSDLWKLLQAKYDPSGTLFKMYQDRH